MTGAGPGPSSCGRTPRPVLREWVTGSPARLRGPAWRRTRRAWPLCSPTSPPAPPGEAPGRRGPHGVGCPLNGPSGSGGTPAAAEPGVRGEAVCAGAESPGVGEHGGAEGVTARRVTWQHRRLSRPRDAAGTDPAARAQPAAGTPRVSSGSASAERRRAGAGPRVVFCQSTSSLFLDFARPDHGCGNTRGEGRGRCPQLSPGAAG